MASYWDSVKVDGADMRLYVSTPEGPGPFPAVVVIQHQGGVDDFMEEMTQRIASAGYLGVSPDLYHRDPADCQDDAPTRRARLRDVTVIMDAVKLRPSGRRYKALPASEQTRFLRDFCQKLSYTHSHA